MFVSLFVILHAHIYNPHHRVFGKIADELKKRKEDRDQRLKKQAGRFRQFLRDFFRKGEDEARLKGLKGEVEDTIKRFQVDPFLSDDE
jgi:hypothetical protein